MKIKTDIITIHERFTPAGIRVLDSKNRVTLGDNVSEHLKIDSYQVLVGENGDVLLRPMTHIPARERWIYEDAKILHTIQKGLKQAKEGKVVKVDNVEKFLEDL